MTTEHVPLDKLPIKERDAYVSEVMRFLLDRGYAIYAPGAEDTPVGFYAVRAAALREAAEYAFENRLDTSTQIAIRLRQRAIREEDRSKRKK